MSNNEPSALRGDYAEQWGHHEIGHLIVANQDFLVYIDLEGDIDWETTPAYDTKTVASSEFSLEKHNAIVSDAALLEVTPSEGFAEETCLHFKRLLGEALACCLGRDYLGAQKMIAAARQYVRSRSEELSRRWYLSASFITCAPFAIGGMLSWACRDWLESILGIDGFWMWLAATAGGVGALLSVITRAGQLQFDASAGRQLHWLEGGSRIGAGVISGLLVALAVRSEIIFSALTQDRRLHSVMVLAALISGAAERLATSIISKFDSGEPNMDAVQTTGHSGRQNTLKENLHE